MKINFDKIDFSQLDIERIELISFLAGIKPTLFYLVNDFELSKSIIQEISGSKKLYFGELGPEELGDAYRHPKTGIVKKNKSRQKYLIFSGHRDVPKKLIESYLNYDFEKVGRMLGYPACCVKYFSKDSKERRQSIQNIFRNTRGRLIFYTNSIYNFSARLNAEDVQDVKRLGGINVESGGYSFYLIPHHPCSFRCEKSIEIGKKTLLALRKFDPVNAELFEKILKKPVLFFDKFHWITFDGLAKKNNIFYQSISPPFSLIEDGILEKFKMGNRISLEEGKVTVFDGGHTVGRLNFKGLDPIILNFNDKR